MGQAAWICSSAYLEIRTGFGSASFAISFEEESYLHLFGFVLGRTPECSEVSDHRLLVTFESTSSITRLE